MKIVFIVCRVDNPEAHTRTVSAVVKRGMGMVPRTG